LEVYERCVCVFGVVCVCVNHWFFPLFFFLLGASSAFSCKKILKTEMYYGFYRASLCLGNTCVVHGYFPRCWIGNRNDDNMMLRFG
jgi:hypothetical protein